MYLWNADFQPDADNQDLKTQVSSLKLYLNDRWGGVG